jgi:pyruvate carboxylase
MKAMAPSIGFVRERTNGIAEGAISYTGDILDPNEEKFTLDHYLQLAKDLENAGSHILAIKDMAGLLKPYAAKEFVSALKDTVDIPIHLHTHDTSSLQPATYMQAIEAGVDAVDVALGGMSGLTSQPNFNSVLAMLEHHERGDKDIDTDKLDALSNYFELVREYYYPFETELKAGTAEVFKHEIPGGQYSNLKPQAVALGLGDRFEEIKKRYREVNEMFGRITKVTPSSKVVGDMALFMVSNDLTPDDVFEKGESLSFPESVESFFRGDLGQPPGGFPEKLQKIVLKDKKPYTDRPNDHLEPVDLEGEFEEFKEKFQSGFARNLEYEDYLSWKLYPKVFEQALETFKQYGDVSRIPTKNFLFGMEENEETIISIAEGKDIIVQMLSVGPANEDGTRTVFFKVNGQTRNVDIDDRSLESAKPKNPKKDPNDPAQIGPSLQGKLSKVLVESGQEVEQNEALFVVEAMKMETTITAPHAATVQKVHIEEGAMVDGDDLVVTLG